MWKPNIETKQGFIGRWLERRRARCGDMDHTQFHWKQIHQITQSQEALGPDEKGVAYIPKGAKTAYPGEKVIEMRFACTDPGMARLFLYASRKHDDIVDVAHGLIEVGDQFTLRDGGRWYYAKSIILDQNWLSPITITNTSMARIMLRTHGYHRFFARLSFSSGQWLVDMVGSSD